jgi:16S rRNA (cytosine967-C5)-methyltransferase
MREEQRAGPGPIDGREAAFLAVRDVFSGRGFVGERLRALRDQRRVAGREAALAMQIALGAVRHALTIDRVLSTVARYDPQRVRPALRSVVGTAAYQIIWMDRVPLFAAGNQAVELARRHVGRRSPGMVNALLRRLTQAIEARRVPWERLNSRQVRVSWDEACAFESEVLPAADVASDHVEHLAAATGERPRRYRKLLERLGPEGAEAVAWACQALPVTVLQRHLLRINSGAFQEQVRANCGAPAECTPDAAFLPPTVNAVALPLFREGRAYIQDMSAHAAASLLAARPGERLLDLCAAPGGKSIVLAQHMNDRGEVIACDAAPDRILQVRENVARLRLTCIRTHLIRTSDASESDLAGKFDAALVDVPCSNTGVIARRPEARLGLTRAKLGSLVKLQGALLRHAVARVRTGGRVVYSTCSIEPEENEQIVSAFLSESPGWELDSQQTWLPSWGPRLSEWRDGGYAARLVRRT